MNTRKIPQIILQLPVKTKYGEFIAGFSEFGLARLVFPKKQPCKNKELQCAGAPGLKVNPEKLTEKICNWQEIVTTELNNYLNGKSIQNMPPLDLSAGTPFQQRVWKALMEIPSGNTMSYNEIAAKIGKPQGARAVGLACGANPIPIFIPCHRVLKSDGSLGGFSAGLTWKKILLTIEGHKFD